jgi:allantoate deiminase
LIRLPSGAGHDAAIMAKITPAAMLFIRCKNGISHHPDESVKIGDVQIAFDVINGFIQSLAEKCRQPAGQSAKIFP